MRGQIRVFASYSGRRETTDVENKDLPGRVDAIFQALEEINRRRVVALLERASEPPRLTPRDGRARQRDGRHVRGSVVVSLANRQVGKP